MKLYEELYFDITASGKKSALVRFQQALASGMLDEFFEFSDDFIICADGFDSAADDEQTSFSIANDDLGISIDEINPEDLLEALCRQSREIDLRGNIYDIEEGEYLFVSPEGDSDFTNARNARFNDELDEQAREDDYDEEEF